MAPFVCTHIFCKLKQVSPLKAPHFYPIYFAHNNHFFTYRGGAKREALHISILREIETFIWRFS